MNWLASSACRGISVSLFSAALLFATASCEDPTDLGVELPGTTPVSTEYHDYPVTAATILQAPTQTLNSTHYLVGRVQDAKLGTTTAQSFCNLRVFTTGSYLFPAEYTNPVLDSAVIVAGFDQVYGTSAAPVYFDVYPLTSPLSDQGTYNSSTNVAVGAPIAVGAKSSLNRKLVLKTKLLVNGVSVDSVTNTPDATVRLTIYRKAAGALPAIPSPLVETIFSAVRDKNTTFTQAILDTKWKGMALRPSTNFTGSVVSFSRVLQNRVFFYYHVDGVDVAPTPYSLTFESFSADAINSPRVFTQLSTVFTAPFNQLTTPARVVPASLADQTAYLQDGVGLGTKLEIAALADLISNREGLAINRAELIIPVKPYSTLLFTPPSRPVLYELGANNDILQRTVNLSPVERLVQADGNSPQGVGTDAAAVFHDLGPTNKYYSIAITSYLQAYIYDLLGAERPAALMLYPVVRFSPSVTVPTANTNLTLNRAVLDAQNIKLRVYSSKLR